MNDKQAEETSKELLEKIKSNLKEEKIYNLNSVNQGA